MNEKIYKSAMGKVVASESFKEETLRLMNSKIEKNNERMVISMKKINTFKMSMVIGCLALAFGFGILIPSTMNNSNKGTNPPVTGKENPGLPMADVAVNIEGTITEVSEDGKSFKLDSGLWVEITDDTELGIDGPTAAKKEDQFFEPTFRVGNSIAGFTEDDPETQERVKAYAIYTNWNWNDPIR